METVSPGFIFVRRADGQDADVPSIRFEPERENKRFAEMRTIFIDAEARAIRRELRKIWKIVLTRV